MVEKHILFSTRIFRTLKKFVACFIVIVFCLMLFGCDYSTIQGIEYCNTYVNDNVEIKYLIYDREFLEKYPYNKGDFFYSGGTFTLCKSLLYLEYEEETYYSAKESLLSNTECSKLKYTYEGFDFYNNVSWIKKYRPYEDTQESLSDTFVMISYNDERKTIVVIGYSNSDPNNGMLGKDIKTEDDFAKFIEQNYLEFYKF